ncbi:MAG: hypothetical protein IT317_03965 [Anaerolineales bacterium]|nr:hypothetical protein [Anaerolineales bacterium]
MQADRRPGLFWPLILIGLGALLLLQNLGYLPAGLWAALAQLWPVVFILLGLDLLVGRRSSAGAAAVLVVGVVVVIGALTWAALRAQQLPAGAPQTLAQPPQGAATLDVTITFDAGELSLSALGPSADALEGEVTNGPGESADLSYRVDNGGVGRLTLDQRGEALLLPFLAARNATAVWAVRLSPSLPLELDVTTGAGRTMLDLTGLEVQTLTLRAGVGETSVTFPSAGALTAVLTTGVGNTTLTLPEGLAARLTVRSGLTNLTVPARFSRADNVYTTSGFDTDGDYLDLELNAGIGNVTIK